jgi:hypothetical protein
MQPTEDEALDDVTAAYKKASGADASRPSSSARAAILADAKRVADGAALNSRTARAAMPAANDSWWNWKIAASLATLGIAGVLALQTLRPLSKSSAWRSSRHPRLLPSRSWRLRQQPTRRRSQ